MEMFNISASEGFGGANESGLSLETPFEVMEMVLIIFGLSSLSLITIIGNILVMLSIKVNRNLQTVNNYFLFSLACADLIVGVFSMNLYTVYIVFGQWPLGALVCDLWLALDYVASNASVMNLLIISFDRYFCVTKPLSYPVRRTTKMAGMMIAAAWILSFILWAPAILFWQFIVGERTVSEGECYIQFFSNATVTFGTAIAAFYLPVVTMTTLYWQISKASRSRVQQRDSRRLSGLSQEDRGPVAVETEGHKNRKTGAETEEMAPERQSGSNGTTEEHESDNESTTGSILASSAPREEETPSRSISPGPNGAINCTKLPPTATAKVSWSKLSCLRAESQNTPEVVRKPGNPSEEPPPQTEKQSLVSPKIFIKPNRRKRRKNHHSRERKVTRTIMAILVAFVATWTPYNVMVLINTFCHSCIPNTMWVMGYWLCYINSTINPTCYALCNVTFKRTFKRLLLCQYKNIRSVR